MPLDFAIIKSLYVHLSDINESHNYHNGSPTDLLAVIPIENKSCGDILTVRFEHPEFKRLKNGAITKLKLVVKDENNNIVDNNGLPMSSVLEKKMVFIYVLIIIISIFGVIHGRVDVNILGKATLNMDGKRIINVAHPRDPVENTAYNGDDVTAKALEMSAHKLKGLGNLVDSDDVKNILQQG